MFYDGMGKMHFLSLNYLCRIFFMSNIGRWYMVKFMQVSLRVAMEDYIWVFISFLQQTSSYLSAHCGKKQADSIWSVGQITNLFCVTQDSGISNHCLSRTFVVFFGYTYMESTGVCTHNTLSNCSCFIAQLAFKLCDWANGKAF